jgi:flagellar motor component MotA
LLSENNQTNIILEENNMYLIGILIFVGLLVGITFFTSAPLVFVDLPSLLVILALSAAVLVASGLMGDFVKGFKLMGQKTNPYSVIELKRIGAAVRLVICSLFLSGGVGSIVGAVAILSQLGDPAAMGPNFAVALLTMLYALVFVLILLPVQARVRAVLATME